MVIRSIMKVSRFVVYLGDLSLVSLASQRDHELGRAELVFPLLKTLCRLRVASGIESKALNPVPGPQPGPCSISLGNQSLKHTVLSPSLRASPVRPPELGKLLSSFHGVSG